MTNDLQTFCDLALGIMKLDNIMEFDDYARLFEIIYQDASEEGKDKAYNEYFHKLPYPWSYYFAMRWDALDSQVDTINAKRAMISSIIYDQYRPRR